jgi:hypothetical protein
MVAKVRVCFCVAVFSDVPTPTPFQG